MPPWHLDDADRIAAENPYTFSCGFWSMNSCRMGAFAGD